MMRKRKPQHRQPRPQTHKQGDCANEVSDFEQRHTLPPLVGVSAAQNGFARRCRYDFLRQSYPIYYECLDAAGKERLLVWLRELKQIRDGEYWIKRKDTLLDEEWLKRIEAVSTAPRPEPLPPMEIAPHDNWKERISRKVNGGGWTEH